MKSFAVEAVWDDEACVWVATSDDVPGLATEADTAESLIKKLEILIPDLLEANGILQRDPLADIPFHLVSHRQAKARW